MEQDGRHWIEGNLSPNLRRTLDGSTNSTMGIIIGGLVGSFMLLSFCAFYFTYKRERRSLGNTPAELGKGIGMGSSMSANSQFNRQSLPSSRGSSYVSSYSSYAPPPPNPHQMTWPAQSAPSRYPPNQHYFNENGMNGYSMYSQSPPGNPTPVGRATFTPPPPGMGPTM